MAKVNIHGAEYPIRKVFSDDFVFTIPRYQRPYAWGTEQAGELLDDLLSFMGNGAEAIEDINPYFLGSIVLIKGDAPDAEVIDGQQRLTTLTILLATLRATLPDKFAEALTPFLYEQGNPITGTPNRYRLKLRPRDADFFREHIQDKDGMTKLGDLASVKLPDAQRNIRVNALLFQQRLAALTEDVRVRLAQFIINRCFLVVVSTPDLDAAYRIFSVLNDRGMDLSYTDILKADIIGKLPESKEETYANTWEDTEEALGREGFQELFAHIRMIFRKVKAAETVLKEIRQYVHPADDPQGFIDDVLMPYAEALYRIKTASYESASGADAVNRSLRWLNRIDNFDWIAPAILYLSLHTHNPDKLAHFFGDLERIASALMLVRANINRRLERYGQLLTAIEDGADLYTEGSPLQLTTQESNAVIEVLKNNVYLHDARLYILLRLDSALSGGEATYNYRTITVEHVLPQHPQDPSVWTEWFPSPELRESWVHRLANLVLLSRYKNSAAQNYDFDKKKTTYFTGYGGVSPFALTTQVLQQSTWTPNLLEAREYELIGKLKQVWRL